MTDRTSALLLREVGRLRDAVQQTRAVRLFERKAWVVLPDHLHCVWTLPEGNADYGTRWRIIKALLARGAGGAARVEPCCTR